MKRLFYTLTAVVYVLLNSCALQVLPQGGAKDVTPPKLISSDPANYSTSFTAKNIRFVFDEYISISDLSTQLIVSPLLKYPPETKLKGKALLIHLEDTLLENTTYTMNFGKGIVDNNEGNKLENFQYVFSTGNVVDSLSINGKVINAFDKKPEKGILVMLYRKSEDSLPFLERPIYFSRTSDSGQYSIRNISYGYYKLIALKETDGNYLYTPGDELIGFTDTLVQSNSSDVNLRVFKENLKPGFLKAYSEFPGKATLVFSGNADSLPWKWVTDTSRLSLYSISYSLLRDTVNIWYKNLNADSISIRFDTLVSKDTVDIRLFKSSSEVQRTPGRGQEGQSKKNNGLVISAGNSQSPMQHLHLPFYLQSNHPLVLNDFSKVILTEDSSKVNPQFIFTDSLHLKISVGYPWKSKTGYSLFIPPSVFKDLFGFVNDSLRIAFSTHSESDYGSLKLHFMNAENLPCIVQLTDVTGGSVFKETSAEKDSVFEFSFLDPGTYRLKIIYDKNRNGKWDTGNYLKHIQPEEIEFSGENITVRANWDVDVKLQASFQKNK